MFLVSNPHLCIGGRPRPGTHCALLKGSLLAYSDAAGLGRFGRCKRRSPR
jgi:hypothetical protein